MKLFLLTVAAALGLLLGPLATGMTASAGYSFSAATDNGGDNGSR
jgi:hypothetical protein